MQVNNQTNEQVILDREICNDAGILDVLEKHFKGEKAWILFWECYRVDFAWYDGEKIHWGNGKEAKEAYLLEARIFNEAREVHIRYENGEIYGRILEEKKIATLEDGKTFEKADSDSNSVQTIYKKVTEPYMWGSIAEDSEESDSNIKVVREDRGMSYHLPCSAKATDFGYRLTQYYIPDLEDGMLRLLDYRMTSIYEEIKYERKTLEIGGVR